MAQRQGAEARPVSSCRLRFDPEDAAGGTEVEVSESRFFSKPVVEPAIAHNQSGSTINKKACRNVQIERAPFPLMVASKPVHC